MLPLLIALAGCASEPEYGDALGGEDSGDPTLPDGVLLTEPVACADPVDAVAYTEVAVARGLLEGPDPDADHTEGASIAILDVDGDGDLDLVSTYPRADVRLYRRQGESFELETLQGPFDPWLPSLADVDGDGLLDLMIGSGQPEVLFGNGTDFDAGEALPTPWEQDEQFSSVPKLLAPGDFDLDGDVDLYAVVNAGGMEPEGYELQDYLLWNNGDGTFTADDAGIGETGQGRGFDAQVVEWEGGPAVYVANDMGVDFLGNALLAAETAGGSTELNDVSEECTCQLVQSAMGMDAADFNRDGRVDLYVAAVPTNNLLEQQSDGSFVDVTVTTGTEGVSDRWGMAWGTHFLDYDNDGKLDILDAQGDQWSADMGDDAIVLAQPIWLLRQGAEGTFTEVGEGLGLATQGSFRSVAAQDLNGDGVLDLLVTDVVDVPKLYESTGCTAEGWLEVMAPLNSRVEVTAGGETWTAWTSTHSGYGGARAPVVHVGLGEHQVVDRVRVVRPTGEETVVDGPFDARRRVVLTETAGSWQ